MSQNGSTEHRSTPGNSANNLRARLKRREPMIAAFIPAPSPELVEIAAYSDFDFVVIDAEHGSIGPGEITHMVRAAQAAWVPALVRVPVCTKDYVLRSLDAGAEGVLVPQVDTIEQAADAIAETHYPPEGRRGAAFYSRQHRYTRDSGWQVLQDANDLVVTGIMIESQAGVDNIEAISRLPDIDLILFGSSDLSVCLGKGPHNAEAVAQARQRIAAAARQAGVSAGCSISLPEEALQQRAAGYNLLVTGLLPLLLRQAISFTQQVRE